MTPRVRSDGEGYELRGVQCNAVVRFGELRDGEQSASEHVRHGIGAVWFDRPTDKQSGLFPLSPGASSQEEG
jgi:hypothetical protein